MTLGIIDVGTNSTHLLIGTLRLDGTFHVLLNERHLTRLGEGGLARNTLTHAAMRRAMRLLQRYAATLKRLHVDQIEAVATSAVREATNGRAFVRQVRTRLGLPLRIISGREEARLIYLGVVQTNRFSQPFVIVTIGGGSAQVIYGEGIHLRYAASAPLGCARLAQRFIRHDPPNPDEVEALRQAAGQGWAPAGKALRRHRWHRALGSSATISQLMLAAYLRTHPRPPAQQNRLSVSRRALARLVDWLSTSAASERTRLPGLDPRREDLALPTGVVLLTWMERCRVSRLHFAPGSIREGLAVDHFIRHHPGQARKIGPRKTIKRHLAGE